MKHRHRTHRHRQTDVQTQTHRHACVCTQVDVHLDTHSVLRFCDLPSTQGYTAQVNFSTNLVHWKHGNQMAHWSSMCDKAPIYDAVPERLAKPMLRHLQYYEVNMHEFPVLGCKPTHCLFSVGDRIADIGYTSQKA